MTEGCNSQQLRTVKNTLITIDPLAVPHFVAEDELPDRIRRSMLLTGSTSAGAMSLDLGLLTELGIFLGMVGDPSTCFCSVLFRLLSEYLEGGISTTRGGWVLEYLHMT